VRPFVVRQLAASDRDRAPNQGNLSAVVRDVSLSRDQMRTALGTAKLLLARADQWPHAAILWHA